MRLFVFDAYGTLFDLHAAAERHREAIGPEWQRLSQTWRTKHLEYTWINTMAGQRASFWTLAERSLDYTIAALGVKVAPTVRAGLLAAYRKMKAYAEVPEVLATLKKGGAKVAILSNGDPDMLADAIAAAGLNGALDAVISVAEAGVFKPDPAVYRLVTQRFACQPGDVSFQSSNRWDIAGAKAAGFRCVWINRAGAPDEYPELAPDRVIRDLRALTA